jgi:protein-tyrosine phosphatase
MARLAVADGITHMACTPHIYPGMYENDAKSIGMATKILQQAMDAAGIPLRLSFAADTHLVPDLVKKLKSSNVPTFNGGKYFLLEPPHHVAPPNFERFVFEVMTAGYVPIITHPERLSWIEGHYAIFKHLALRGAWMQLTAGSLTGRFGKSSKYWGERMLDDGLVHILATDSHSPNKRPPYLAEGREAAAKWVGEDEADFMVYQRPQAVLDNLEPVAVRPIVALAEKPKRKWSGLLQLFA